MQYTLLAKDKNSEARCGVLTTAHGEIHTLSLCRWERWDL